MKTSLRVIMAVVWFAVTASAPQGAAAADSGETGSRFAIYGTWSGSRWSAEDMEEEADGLWTLTADVPAGFEFQIKEMDADGSTISNFISASCDDAYVKGGITSNYTIASGASYTFRYDPALNDLTVTCNSVASYAVYGTWSDGRWSAEAMAEENGAWRLTADIEAGFEFGIRELSSSGTTLATIKNALCDDSCVSGGGGENYKIDLGGNYTFEYLPGADRLNVACNSIDESGMAWWCPFDMTGTPAGWKFDNQLNPASGGTLTFNIDTSESAAEYTAVAIFYAPQSIKWNTDGTQQGNQLNWNRVTQANVWRYVPADANDGSDCRLEASALSPMKTGDNGEWLLARGVWTMTLDPLGRTVGFALEGTPGPDDPGAQDAFLVITPFTAGDAQDMQGFGDSVTVSLANEGEGTYSAQYTVTPNDCVMLRIGGEDYTFTPDTPEADRPSASVNLGGGRWRHYFYIHPNDDPKAPYGLPIGIDSSCTFIVNFKDKTLSVENDVSTSLPLLRITDRGETAWYDLQGRCVARPGSGMFIRIADGKAEKIRR